MCLSMLSDDNGLKIAGAVEDDSGSYECKIMVEQEVTVTHSLTVARIFTIQSDPADALVTVPLRGHTRYVFIKRE